MKHFLLFSMISATVSATTCETSKTTGPCSSGLPCSTGSICDDTGMCCLESDVITSSTSTSTTQTSTSTQIVSTTTTSLSASNSSCFDRINPLTRVSDCSQRSYLCSNLIYYNLMTVQCPKTCGRCSSNTVSPKLTVCADKLNISTGRSDCPNRRNYCDNSVYRSLMQTQCPKTCGYCK